MTATLPPFYLQHFFDPNNTGAPLQGGKLFTYIAGTSTKRPTWTDSTQSVQNSNPIILDSRGECKLWLDPTQLYKLVLAPANDSDPPTSPIDTIDNVSVFDATTLLTRQFIGQILWPQTAAEAAAGVTPTFYYYENCPNRYGALGNGIADDSPAFNTMGKVNGYHFVYDGTYLINEKIQTSAFITVEGSTRQNTLLLGADFPDYVMEIGNQPAGPNPNVGELKRLRFTGTVNNAGLLHMNQLSHEWRLDELLFQSAPCPALVNDNCWDANYTNIDILSCGYPNNPPDVGAAVKIINGSNNVYFRGLRIEQCPSGCIYVGPACSPIWVVEGKIDMGFIAQFSSCVTIDYVTANPGSLSIEDYTFTGISGQWIFNVKGALRLTNVDIGGGSGSPAAIFDQRVWCHIDSTTLPGSSDAAFQAFIPSILLGSVTFARAHPSIPTAVMPSAIYSKIPAIRPVLNLSVLSNGSPGGGQLTIGTNLTVTFNDQYKGMYLVHNPTGTQAVPGATGSRRLILNSFPGGNLVVKGEWGCTVDNDWSIEYCAGHYTPNLVIDNVTLDQQMTLFVVLSTGATITSVPFYMSSAGLSAAGAATNFTLSATGFPINTDLTGLYLVDEITGEPFFLTYGVDGSGFAAVAYDRTASLNQSHTYSIVGGCFADIAEEASNLEWSFAGKRKSAPIAALLAAGFNATNIPIWGFGVTGEAIAVPYSASITLDASQAHEFILAVTNASAFTVNAPVNLVNGDRLLVTIKNTSGGAMGAVTWNAIFKMPAFTNPTNGNGYTVEFWYDGTNLRQVNTPPLVPN
jgi:hypothetical protein